MESTDSCLVWHHRSVQIIFRSKFVCLVSMSRRNPSQGAVPSCLTLPELKKWLEKKRYFGVLVRLAVISASFSFVHSHTYRPAPMLGRLCESLKHDEFGTLLKEQLLGRHQTITALPQKCMFLCRNNNLQTNRMISDLVGLFITVIDLW